MLGLSRALGLAHGSAELGFYLQSQPQDSRKMLLLFAWWLHPDTEGQSLKSSALPLALVLPPSPLKSAASLSPGSCP